MTKKCTTYCDLCGKPITTHTSLNLELDDYNGPVSAVKIEWDLHFDCATKIYQTLMELKEKEDLK